uniref:Dephospho-CoA kinase domain-containing protein n=1 Tax=Lygus hesperus TaxID=30085 RepID=A0A0A9Y3C7_LYGHE
MFLVGLTGGIGTGKSSVAKMLEARNIPVVDADFFARKVVEPGKPAWRKIKFHFGEEVFKEHGEIDRQRLGQIVFEDVEKRRKLNHIVHPEIYKEIFWVVCGYFFKGYSFVVLDLPLLFEHGAVNCYMHKIIVVTCDKEQQIQRVMARDNADENYAKARISSQWPIEEKAKRANFVVDNSGSLEETEEQVEKMVRILRDDKFHIRLRAFIALGGTLIIGSMYLFLFSRY